MKRIFFFLLSAYTCLQAMGAEPNETVLNRFKENYPTAENVVWSTYPDHYVVYFKRGEEQCRLWYNKGGEVMKSIRYYEKALLHPFIRSKVESRYKGWHIKYVTELSSDEGILYNVTVEKGLQWHSLMVNPYGQITVENKYRKRP